MLTIVFFVPFSIKQMPEGKRALPKREKGAFWAASFSPHLCAYFLGHRLFIQRQDRCKFLFL